jgi:RNA polymerase sigma-70 factor (ECF subfamily)
MVQGAGHWPMTDDWACLDLARGGDQTAWRVLFAKYYHTLVKMSSFITGSLDSAEDIAQEAFVNLHRVEIRHRNGSFKSFLTTIAYRLALKERKRQHTDRKLDALVIADDTPSSLEKAIRDETDRMIVRTIQALSFEHREILALRFFGDHSYEEIAKITEIPIGTVKSRIFHAIKICHERLKEQGVFT